MYEYIKGKLAYLQDTYAAVEANGVAYRIYVTSRTAGALKSGEDVTLYTYLAIREDDMTLYGFSQMTERSMFEKLIGVSGVGPKAAMSILSAMDISQIASALMSSDSKAFARANGIGTKTANRIILELKDKVDIADVLGSTAAAEFTVPSAGQSGAANEALEALISLGYNRNEAAQAIAAVREYADSAEELTLMALKRMSL